jgi:hypothetical protein
MSCAVPIQGFSYELSNWNKLSYNFWAVIKKSNCRIIFMELEPSPDSAPDVPQKKILKMAETIKHY